MVDDRIRRNTTYRHRLSVFHRRLPSATHLLYDHLLLFQNRLQSGFITFKLCVIIIAADTEVHHSPGFLRLKSNSRCMIRQCSGFLGGSCCRRDLRCCSVYHHTLAADIVAHISGLILRTGIDNIMLFCAQRAGNRHLSVPCCRHLRKLSGILQGIQFSLCLCRCRLFTVSGRCCRKGGRIHRINIIVILCDTTGLIYTVLRIIGPDDQIQRRIRIEPSEGHGIQQLLPPVLLDGDTEIPAVSCSCLPAGRRPVDLQRHLHRCSDITVGNVPYIKCLGDLAFFGEHIARTCAVHSIGKCIVYPYITAQSTGQLLIQSTCVHHPANICVTVRCTK